MAKIGTAHVEVKAIVNEESLKAAKDDLAGAFDGIVGVNSMALVVAAVRIHEAVYFLDADELNSLPEPVIVAWGELQSAIRRLGIQL